MYVQIYMKKNGQTGTKSLHFDKKKFKFTKTTFNAKTVN